MSKQKMWFGNRNRMQWVNCPVVGAAYAADGRSISAGFLSGGRHHRQTFTAAKRFSLTWSGASSDDVRAITDYVDGVYGPGNIYWADPFTMRKNVAPQSLATPALAGYDATPLVYEYEPQVVATSANPNGYPFQSAVYTLAGTETVQRYYFPIPPGHTAWVGVHGSATGTAAITVEETIGTLGGATAQPALLTVGDATRVNHSVDYAEGAVDGIEVYLDGAGTITLSGIIVQILPTGETPETGGFISGQGHSGCSFDGYPTKDMYSAFFDVQGLTAELVEVGQWQ